MLAPSAVTEPSQLVAASSLTPSITRTPICALAGRLRQNAKARIIPMTIRLFDTISSQCFSSQLQFVCNRLIQLHLLPQPRCSEKCSVLPAHSDPALILRV